MISAPLSILVTNDDGPSSPFLPSFLRLLRAASWCSTLHAVIPSVNQSWISGALSRHRPVALTLTTIAGLPVTLAGGTPGDCVSIALSGYTTPVPDLVLSGINLGINAGLPFTFSSGTIAGAAFAGLSGVLGFALSAEIPAAVFSAWETAQPCEMWDKDFERISARIVAIIPELLGWATPEIDILSVNVPWGVTENTPVRRTELQPGRFGKLYVPGEDGTYRHRMSPLHMAQGSGLGDWEVVLRGEISVSALQLGPRSIPPRGECR